MEYTINEIALVITGVLTLELSLVTARQAYLRWSWFFAPKIPAGANGRWKLDWLSSFFFLLVSAQQWLWITHSVVDHYTTIACVGLAIITLALRRAVRHESQHREEMG